MKVSNNSAFRKGQVVGQDCFTAYRGWNVCSASWFCANSWSSEGQIPKKGTLRLMKRVNLVVSSTGMFSGNSTVNMIDMISIYHIWIKGWGTFSDVDIYIYNLFHTLRDKTNTRHTWPCSRQACYLMAFSAIIQPNWYRIRAPHHVHTRILAKFPCTNPSSSLSCAVPIGPGYYVSPK